VETLGPATTAGEGRKLWESYCNVVPVPLYDRGIFQGSPLRANDLLLNSEPSTAPSRLLVMTRSMSGSRANRFEGGPAVLDVRCDRHYDQQSLTMNSKTPPDAEAVAGYRFAVWAWVELNYRPHAYQAI